MEMSLTKVSHRFQKRKVQYVTLKVQREQLSLKPQASDGSILAVFASAWSCISGILQCSSLLRHVTFSTQGIVVAPMDRGFYGADRVGRRELRFYCCLIRIDRPVAETVHQEPLL